MANSNSTDRMNRALTGATSRRQALKLLGGGLVGGVAVGAGLTAATAQSNQRTNVGQLVSGLINVNVGAVAVNVGDITFEDLVDVNDVLNDNEVRILNNVLNRSPILSNNSEILTNLLREADILNDVQVVVGVLSGSLVFQ
jgi:hypothetical protein